MGGSEFDDEKRVLIQNGGNDFTLSERSLAPITSMISVLEEISINLYDPRR